MISASFSAISQSQFKKQPTIISSFDGIPIAYEAHGKGIPALVFVHGWSCDRSYWNGQLEPFSTQYKVIAIDLAGHGESGLGRKAWTTEAFGSDVAAVVKKLDLKHVVLIGHSMGGAVVTEAARHLPGRVVGLIWIDVFKKLGSARSPEQVRAFMAPLRTHFVDSTRVFVRGMFLANSDSSLIERVVMDMSSAPPQVAVEALEYGLNYSRKIPQVLQELKIPVIAINSDSAPTDTISMQQNGVKVIFMSGVGHFLMLEDPERFNRILTTAVGELVDRHRANP
jgi:pimeloyl-ACP methyl ester carboxylesterase